MALFGRSRQSEPGKSEAYLARQAHIQALIAAEPEPRFVSASEMWGHVTGPAHQALDEIDFGKLDGLYSAQPDAEHRLVFVHELRNALDESQGFRQRELYRRALEHQSALSMMLASYLAIIFAGEARGQGTLDAVAEEGKLGFEDWNARGKEIMERAAELSQYSDPFAYIVGSSAAIADEDSGISHAKKWQAIDPWNPLGWDGLLYQQDARWSGDWTALPRMARYVAEHAPAGHPVLPEVVTILNRHWFTLRSFGEMSSEDAQAAAWRNNGAAYTLSLAFSKFASAFQGGIRQVRHWDRFAFGMSEAGLFEEALTAMRELRGRYYVLWGERYQDPVRAYRASREEAFNVAYRRANPLPEDAYDSVDWGPKGPPALA